MPELKNIKKCRYSYTFEVDNDKYEVSLSGKVYINYEPIETVVTDSCYLAFYINDKLVTISEILFQCSDWLRRNGSNTEEN